MPTNYPTSLDNGTSLPTKAGGNTISSSETNTQSDALKALEAKLGIGASTPGTTGYVLRASATGVTGWVNPLTYFEVAGAAATAQAASQPLDSDLTAIAAVATTTYGRALLALADAAAARAALGLAPIALSGSAADLSAGTIPAARMPAHTGDVTTVAGAVATTLASVGPGATGPIGSASVVPVITIDTKGRVTALTSATITSTTAWLKASQGGGAAGTKMWVGTTTPSSPTEGDVWVVG